MTHWTEEMFLERGDVFRPLLERRADSAAEEVDALLALLADEHDREPETALDVACGVGRHAVELAGRGLEVTGVDLSEAYVEAARERAAAAGVGECTTFVVGDMRELGAAVDGRFDLVTSMWTSFGYFDDATNEAVAAGLAERVGDGGALVLELSNKEGVLADFVSSAASEVDGSLHAERREYDPERSRMAVTLTVFDRAGGDGRTDGEEQAGGDDSAGGAEPAYDLRGEVEWDVRLYAPVELRRLLERAGFGSVACYARLDGEALSRESPRLVVVAEP